MKKKKKVDRSDCIFYNVVKYKNFGIVVINNKNFINFIILKGSLTVQLDTIQLNINSKESLLTSIFPDSVLRKNDGINALINISEKKNKKRQNINYYYIKTRLLNLIQLIFINNKLKYIYIYPEEVKYDWNK